MSQVITFPQTFPAYHPKAGQPTYFVEKIWNGIINNSFEIDYAKVCTYNNELSSDILCPFWKSINIGFSGLGAKHHTIRSGNRWKVGDKFSPRVWSGKPYQSKQITIAPDIEVKNVWDFEIKKTNFHGEIFITHSFPELGIYNFKERVINPGWIEEIAENDGLSITDFMQWFRYPKPFSGQIICWNENINY